MRRAAVLAFTALLGCSSSADNILGHSNAGFGGASGEGGGAGAGEDAAAESAPPYDAALTPRLASNMTITEVALFQAVKIPLFKDGAVVTDRNAPILAGRKAVVRVYVQPDAAWAPHPLTAEVRLEAGGVPTWYAVTSQPSGSSDDAVVSSLLQVELPAEAIVEGANISVRLTDATSSPIDDGVTHPARWPADGSGAPLQAGNDAEGLRLRIVPIQYNTDGSGRLPDTSDTQLGIIKGLLTSLYPLVHVDLSVRDPVPFDKPKTWDGDVDFDALNDILFALKESDGSPTKEYYFGLISPDDTFDDYCNMTCTTGQSYVVKDAGSGKYRVGAGVGFSGEDSAWTLAHELGHLHGRGHAPCDVSTSSYFPYAEGSIGVWGWDPRTGKFMDPAKVSDLMGYCEPAWTSDYTYKGIFQRVLEVNMLPTSGHAPGSWRFVRESAGGGLVWGAAVALDGPPGGTPREVRFIGAHGEVVGAAMASEVMTSRGRATWLVPAAPASAKGLEVAGRRLDVMP